MEPQKLSFTGKLRLEIMAQRKEYEQAKRFFDMRYKNRLWQFDHFTRLASHERDTHQAAGERSLIAEYSERYLGETVPICTV